MNRLISDDFLKCVLLDSNKYQNLSKKNIHIEQIHIFLNTHIHLYSLIIHLKITNENKKVSPNIEKRTVLP